MDTVKIVLSIIAVVFCCYYACFRDDTQTPEIMGRWESGTFEAGNVPFTRAKNVFNFGKTTQKAEFIKTKEGADYAAHEIHPLTSSSNLFDQSGNLFYSIKGSHISFFKKSGETEYEQYHFYGELQLEKIKIYKTGAVGLMIIDVLERR